MTFIDFYSVEVKKATVHFLERCTLPATPTPPDHHNNDNDRTVNTSGLSLLMWLNSFTTFCIWTESNHSSNCTFESERRQLVQLQVRRKQMHAMRRSGLHMKDTWNDWLSSTKWLVILTFPRQVWRLVVEGATRDASERKDWRETCPNTPQTVDFCRFMLCNSPVSERSNSEILSVGRI